METRFPVALQDDGSDVMHEIKLHYKSTGNVDRLPAEIVKRIHYFLLRDRRIGSIQLYLRECCPPPTHQPEPLSSYIKRLYQRVYEMNE